MSSSFSLILDTKTLTRYYSGVLSKYSRYNSIKLCQQFQQYPKLQQRFLASNSEIMVYTVAQMSISKVELNFTYFCCFSNYFKINLNFCLVMPRYSRVFTRRKSYVLTNNCLDTRENYMSTNSLQILSLEQESGIGSCWLRC